VKKAITAMAAATMLLTPAVAQAKIQCHTEPVHAWVWAVDAKAIRELTECGVPAKVSIGDASNFNRVTATNAVGAEAFTWWTRQPAPASRTSWTGRILVGGSDWRMGHWKVTVHDGSDQIARFAVTQGQERVSFTLGS
jgi:opacity protein-like surface antigen